MTRLIQIAFGVGFIFAKDSDNVFHWHHEKLIIGLEVDWNRVFGMEENLVVLSQRHILVVCDLAADGHNPASNGGDLSRIGQSDSAFGLALGFVLQHQHSRSDRFDVLERCAFLGHKAFCQWNCCKTGVPRRVPACNLPALTQRNGDPAGRQDDFGDSGAGFDTVALESNAAFAILARFQKP